MDVVIDGIPGFAAAQSGTVTEVIAEIDEALRARGRALVSLSVDGQAVSPESLAARFVTLAAGSACIEVTSRPLDELISEALDELSTTLPELPVACRKLAEVFQSETPEQGFEPFTELARIWEHVKSRQRMICSALDIDFDALVVEGRALAEHGHELNSFLDEAAQALRHGDLVLLADLLEYELAPRAELEAGIVAALRKQVRPA